MLLGLKEMKDVASKLLQSIDTGDLGVNAEVIELYNEAGCLNFCITNGEYFVKAKIAVNDEEPLHATIKATQFLKLISQFSTETVTLEVEGNTLLVRGDGVCKFPMIYLDEKMLTLPKIEIINQKDSFDIPTSVLRSISTYNAKELMKGGILKPVQTFYYIDNEGCITFSSGACINHFSLEKQVKFLLNNKIVKLFKLFTTDVVHFTIGYDAMSENVVYTKISLLNDQVELTAVLAGDASFREEVPVASIRGRAMSKYPYAVTFDRKELLGTIDRLLISAGNVKPYSIFTFDNNSQVCLSNENAEYTEKVSFECEGTDVIEYTAFLDLKDVKLALEGCSEDSVLMKFGDGQAVVLTHGSVDNIIPETVLN